MNAAALFRDAARAHPRRSAFVESGRAIAFEELWERVCRFAGALRAEGFAPGERALVLLPMSVRLYVALLAVLKEGGIAVFIDPWVGARAMTRLARHARVKAWLGTPKSHLLRLFVRGVPIAPLSLTRFGKTTPHADIHEVADDARALITFTTGSSGNPKGVNRTHRILIAQHERLAAEFPPREGDVDLCTFPVFALNNLALGVTTVIPPIDLRRVADADPHRVARAANDAGVTTCTASPPLFDKLARIAERPRLRRILTGGAPVSDAQLRDWSRAWPDAEIVVAYGSSEAEPVAHVDAHERLAARGRGYLAGRIVQGVRARLEPLVSPVILSREDDEGPPAVNAARAVGRGSFAVSAASRKPGCWRVTRRARNPVERWALAHRALGTILPRAGRHWGRVSQVPGGLKPTAPQDDVTNRSRFFSWVQRRRSERAQDDRRIGELLVTGEHVCRDYDGDAEATRRNKVRDADGTVWHRMGDTGFFDEHGRFWIAGRVHSTMWRDGTAVHAQLVEQAAQEDDPRIRRVAALSVDGRIVVVVESDEDVEDDVRARLAAAGEPCDRVVVRSEPLPVDPRHNSKTDYEVLRRTMNGERR